MHAFKSLKQWNVGFGYGLKEPAFFKERWVFGIPHEGKWACRTGRGSRRAWKGTPEIGLLMANDAMTRPAAAGGKAIATGRWRDASFLQTMLLGGHSCEAGA